jgi:hypothetical protein
VAVPGARALLAAEKPLRQLAQPLFQLAAIVACLQKVTPCLLPIAMILKMWNLAQFLARALFSTAWPLALLRMIVMMLKR